MTDFFQTIATAIALGSLYALIALGYTLVYGVLKFINFAHSDVVVLGGWVSYIVAVKLLGIGAGAGPAWYVGAGVLVAAMLACGALGWLIERLAYRPLRGAPRLNVLITAIGVSLLLQNVGQLPIVFGAQPAGMPALAPVEPWNLGGVRVSPVDAIIFVTAIALMLALQALVYRTRLGLAMRAVSQSVTSARLMGVNVDAVIGLTFVLGSMLAAAAGFLWAIKFNLQITSSAQWVMLGLTAFVAAVVGGIGSIGGAVLGAYLIAFIQQLGVFALGHAGVGDPAGLKDVIVFVLLIAVLLVRPEGLLGTPTREKV